MKKILILLAALLYIFASEAQTKISQDSIETIEGQKVGRLRPVVSNGFYQQSSDGGNSYNKVLDTETGVPIDLILTGQEAIDSLSANIARTDYALSSDLMEINKHSSLRFVGKTLWGYETGIQGIALTMVDGTVYTALQEVNVEDTIIGVMFLLDTKGSFTGDNFSGFGLYKGNDLVAQTINNPECFQTVSSGYPDTVYFTTEVAVIPSDTITIAAVYNDAASGTAPLIDRVTPQLSVLRSLYGTYPFHSYSGQTTLPATINFQSATGLTTSGIYVRLIGKQ